MQRPQRYPRRHRTAVASVAVAAVAGLAVWGVLSGALGTAADGAADQAGSSSAELAPALPAATDAEASPTSPAPPATTPSSGPEPTNGPEPSNGPEPTGAGIDLAAHSTTDPGSIWVIVNKQHPIAPSDYSPADLVTVDGASVRQVVQADLEAMLAGAEADGVRIGLRTAYRSYGAQAAIRADVEARRGFAHAEKYSARPGYSEHQTGLAFDLHGTSQPGCDLQSCFADTAEGRWVAAHAGEYGFLVRYTPDNTGVTGFAPEAWHLRYVGRELAGWMAANGVGSLEEALGVTGGPDYAAGT